MPGRPAVGATEPPIAVPIGGARGLTRDGVGAVGLVPVAPVEVPTAAPRGLVNGREKFISFSGHSEVGGRFAVSTAMGAVPSTGLLSAMS